MFNITVINIKDLIKYLLALTVVIAVIFWGKGYFFYEKNSVSTMLANNNEKYKSRKLILPLDVSIPFISSINNLENKEQKMEEKDETIFSKVFNYIIGKELGIVDIVSKEKNIIEEDIAIENKEKNEGKSDQTDVENKELNDNIELNEDKNSKKENINTNIDIKVVTKNPLKDSFTNTYNGVKIKNETDFNLNDEMLNHDEISVDKSNVIIFHTHTCESYTSSEKFQYNSTGNFRTTDLNYSVVKVGDELANNLNSYGINVIHNKTYHDYPSYTGSYSRSLSTVSKILNETKADIIIDLHRDAIGNYNTYAPTVKIGEDYCAQLMFVIGTNGGGLYHPNWKTNLKWAVSIQEKANKKYPGLFKTMILRKSRYNQHLGKAACIIEVGATGNDLDQCLNSMKYLADIIGE